MSFAGQHCLVHLLDVDLRPHPGGDVKGPEVAKDLRVSSSVKKEGVAVGIVDEGVVGAGRRKNSVLGERNDLPRVEMRIVLVKVVVETALALSSKQEKSLIWEHSHCRSLSGAEGSILETSPLLLGSVQEVVVVEDPLSRNSSTDQKVLIALQTQSCHHVVCSLRRSFTNRSHTPPGHSLNVESVKSRMESTAKEAWFLATERPDLVMGRGGRSASDKASSVAETRRRGMRVEELVFVPSKGSRPSRKWLKPFLQRHVERVEGVVGLGSHDAKRGSAQEKGAV